MTGLPEIAGVRPEIARSWLRADHLGLDPADVFARLTPVEVDVDTPLLQAAAPVLDELDERLRGTSCCTVLVDRECRVVRRWSDDRRIEAGLDSLNIRVGASLLEEEIGTNALGTVMETRHSVTIHGEEHFAEVLRQFSCYGHPVRHPLTHRIEGVLDITMISLEANPLLPALIARAVADIEQRLLDGSRASEKRLLDAFQAATALRRRAVVAIGDDVVLSNQAAMDLLGPDDIGNLRLLAGDPGRRAAGTCLALGSGRVVKVAVTPVLGAVRGALLQLEPRDAGADDVHVPSPRRSRPRSPAPRLVSGPPGSGRTTRALELANRSPVTVLGASRATVDRDGWARDFAAAMTVRSGSVVVDGSLRSVGTVVVDGIDLLDDPLLELVIEHVGARDRPQVVLTSAPASSLTGPAAALVSMATQREETLPLAARRQEIPRLAARMIEQLEPGAHVRLMPPAVAALSARSWPGNLHELHAVLEHALERRWGDAISVKDLPDGYRSEVPERPIALLDQAQRDAIMATLRQHGGNKVKAAHELGISRTTLYARMKALRITAF